MKTTISDIVGTLKFPAEPPVQGYFASLAVLDDLGFLNKNGDYDLALDHAGFDIVDQDGKPYLEVSPHPKGIFSCGVGKEAETVFAALASEGFVGEIREATSQSVWYLSEGRVVALSHEKTLAC